MERTHAYVLVGGSQVLGDLGKPLAAAAANAGFCHATIMSRGCTAVVRPIPPAFLSVHINRRGGLAFNPQSCRCAPAKHVE